MQILIHNNFCACTRPQIAEFGFLFLMHRDIDGPFPARSEYTLVHTSAIEAKFSPQTGTIHLQVSKGIDVLLRYCHTKCCGLVCEVKASKSFIRN